MTTRTLVRPFQLAAAAIALATVPAHAVCGRPPPVTVWPHRGIPVPTNARVMMTAPTTWRADATLFLVEAPRSDTKADARTARARIALREQSWRAAGTERFELTPLSPLAPSTPYELRSSRNEVLGFFTTSVLADSRPPTWSGLTGGALHREAPKAGAKTIPLECGADLLRLRGTSAATDDQTATDEVRYALWAAKAGTPLPYAAPPLTWKTRDDRSPTDLEFTLVFGSSDADAMDFELPKDRPLRVGVKAYDLAGNAGEPSELTLE